MSSKLPTCRMGKQVHPLCYEFLLAPTRSPPTLSSRRWSPYTSPGPSMPAPPSWCLFMLFLLPETSSFSPTRLSSSDVTSSRKPLLMPPGGSHPCALTAPTPASPQITTDRLMTAPLSPGRRTSPLSSSFGAPQCTACPPSLSHHSHSSLAQKAHCSDSTWAAQAHPSWLRTKAPSSEAVLDHHPILGQGPLQYVPLAPRPLPLYLPIIPVPVCETEAQWLRAWALEPTTQFPSQPCPLPAVCPGDGPLISLRLSFLVRRVRMIK